MTHRYAGAPVQAPATRRALRRVVPTLVRSGGGSPTREAFARLGYFRMRTWAASHGQPVPDAASYRPLYSPWLGDAEFSALYDDIRAHTLVTRDRAWVLRETLRAALAIDGAVLECGVFRGGTAILEARTIAASGRPRALHLVDSFEGMPETSAEIDRFQRGDFAQVSVEDVRARLAPFAFAQVHQGWIPEILAAVDADRFSWIHVDLDVYPSVLACLEAVWPRLAPGGTVVFDDYGFPSCPGARRAVDEFFATRDEVALCLPTGQAVVHRLPA